MIGAEVGSVNKSEYTRGLKDLHIITLFKVRQQVSDNRIPNRRQYLTEGKILSRR